MTMKISTGLANHILAIGSVKNALDGGLLHVYAGTEPATADAALGGATLLYTYSDAGSGAGLNFDSAASAGVLAKDPDQVWSSLSADAGGTATFCRFVQSDDDGSASSSAVRIQGDVATLNAFLNLNNVEITAGAPQVLNAFRLGLISGG